MKYPTNKQGYYPEYYRTQIRKQIQDLSQVKYTVEHIFKNQDEPIIELTGPVVFITPYKVTTWESMPSNLSGKGEKLTDDHFIMLHPKLYSGVLEGNYAWLPDAIFTIPANKKPYAIPMCFYLSTQQKLGWRQHGGVIQQPIETFLRGAGIWWNLPKQRGKWKQWVEDRINDLKWMKGDKAFWIKRVHVEPKGFLLDRRIIVEPSENIPLKTLLREQPQHLQGPGTKKG
jgi:hypothetical protein